MTRETCEAMPRSPREMSNDAVIVLAFQNFHVAREEMLRREIMVQDELTWEEANVVVGEMKESVRDILRWGTVPYRAGATASLLAGSISVPLVFSHDAVKRFNDVFVTMDAVPEKEIETFWEVGAWAWNWMEPPLGTVSFVLLCAQYARNQLANVGSTLSPYQAWLYRRRRARLAARYPRYHRDILNNFAETLAYNHLGRDDGIDDGFSLGGGRSNVTSTATSSSAI